ncbi:hypothetical protein NKJ71_19650 [Mesorhizobium sp. M0050]|uniref:hypothetical protein n=1 Tax=Mesorhizobium sp. M0050 TaxID=2956861 RepID=UPI003336118F
MTTTAAKTDVEQVEEKARAWIIASFSDPRGDWQSRFTVENMETAYCAGFSAGLEHARKVFMGEVPA